MITHRGGDKQGKGKGPWSSAVLKFVLAELHERGGRAPGIPEQQQHGAQKQEPHACIKGVIGNLVRAAQAVAAQLQTTHPALEIQEQENTAHDDSPDSGPAVTPLGQQAHGHHQFHGQPQTRQRKGEKGRKYAAAGQKIDHFVHAGNFLHGCEEEKDSQPDAQHGKQHVDESIVFHGCKSTPALGLRQDRSMTAALPIHLQKIKAVH